MNPKTHRSKGSGGPFSKHKCHRLCSDGCDQAEIYQSLTLLWRQNLQNRLYPSLSFSIVLNLMKGWVSSGSSSIPRTTNYWEGPTRCWPCPYPPTVSVWSLQAETFDLTIVKCSEWRAREREGGWLLSREAEFRLVGVRPVGVGIRDFCS